MWFLSKIALAGGVVFFAFQIAAMGQKSNEPATPSSSVGATQAVITVRGICDAAAGKGANDAGSCTQIISREQFETLVEALNPQGQVISATARQNLAKTYTELLAVEAAAKKAGLEDTPQFRELAKWVRLRAVTDLYRDQLQQKYRNPSEDEIKAHYQQHLAEFERVNLVRILVPRESLSAPDKAEFDKKALETAQAARDRASKGEDPAQIQKDAYTALGLNAPPSTDLGKRRRADLVADEAADIFSLKPGEVTQVEREAKNYVIYKVLAKDTLSEEEAKADVAREIYQQKFKAAMKSAIDAAPAELNQQYFGPGASAPPASGLNGQVGPKGH
jgi:hypothetical protein